MPESKTCVHDVVVRSKRLRSAGTEQVYTKPDNSDIQTLKETSRLASMPVTDCTSNSCSSCADFDQTLSLHQAQMRTSRPAGSAWTSVFTIGGSCSGCDDVTALNL